MGQSLQPVELDHQLDLFKDVLTGAIYPESAWRRLESYRPPRVRWWPPDVGWPVAHLAARILKRFNLAIVRTNGYDREKREGGLDWPIFGYTMIGRKRLDNIQECIENIVAENVEGDLIETGVWRGGAAMLMKATLKALGENERNVWLADTFAGLPPPSGKHDGLDLSWNEFLAVDRATVLRNFARFDLLDARVKTLEGLFCDTLPHAPIRSLALLRLDGDLYSSTMDSLVNLYGKVSEGGYVIVDDYYSWASCRRAVTEYLDEIGEQPEIIDVDRHCVYWRKTART